MDKKQFVDLDILLGVKPKADFTRPTKLPNSTTVEFMTKIFELDNEGVLKLINQGGYDFASNLQMPLKKAEKYYFDDEFMRDLFKVLSHAHVCVGFLDKGWGSVCYSEFSGNTLIMPSIIKISANRDDTFCYVAMLNKIEPGGFLSAVAGFGDTYKEAPQDIEIRTIHSFGKTK